MSPQRETKPTLETVIGRLLTLTENLDPQSNEYRTLVDHLTKLYKLKETDSKSHVSADTWVIAATNLVGLIMILQYERLHVVTSKAIAFVTKLR